MPAPEPGHGGTRLNPIPGPRLTQPDPPAPLQGRRKSTPPVAPLATSLPSRRTRTDRQPPCHRQIPIDQTARTAAPNPPAVSSPEASPTPADRVRATGPATAGVREPLTTARAMPTFAAGHGLASFNALASPQISQQIPPVPPPSRRKSTAAAVADGQILAIQQTTQRPQATPPPSNPHRPNRPNRRA